MTGKSGAVIFQPKAIVVSCRDHRRSAEFYEGVLGATRLPGDFVACPWLRLGPWELSLIPNASEDATDLVPTHAATMLVLQVDDLPTAYQYCVDMGVEIIEPPSGPFMIIADPDGLQIEVWQTDDAD